MSITPEDIILDSNFKQLAKVHHDNIKPFIIEQLSKKSLLATRYRWYQLLMVIVLGTTIAYGSIKAFNGSSTEISLFFIGVFISITLLVIVHELIHILTLLLIGVRNISFGLDLWKFIFYVHADKQVLTRKKFFRVALSPFIVVKAICSVAIMWAIITNHSIIVWLVIMAIHSFFCAGDIGLLCLYQNHPDEEILTFDIKADKCSYFYARKR
jgi:hypothetical protein